MLRRSVCFIFCIYMVSIGSLLAQDGVQTINLLQYSPKSDFRMNIQKPMIMEFQFEFSPGEAGLTAKMEPDLEKIKEFLNWRPDTEVEIIGHTDSIPPPHSSPFLNNKDLSKARAKSIAKFLSQTVGIDPDRIRVYGRGDSEPKSTNSTEEGRSLNRRMEVRFVKSSKSGIEKNDMKFHIVVSISDQLRLKQMLLHSILPSGWRYLVNSGLIGHTHINPEIVGPNKIVWDVGKWKKQRKMDLEFSLVPSRYTEIVSISVLKSYIEYTLPSGTSAFTDTIITGIPTRVQESLFRFTLPGTTFDVNRWEIKPSTMNLLTPLSDFLNWQTDVDIIIEGYTDSTGNFESNKKLSENRASSVRDHLIQVHGIAPNRLDFVGYGPQFSVAPNNTAKGMALNRRVEFLVKSDFQQTISKVEVVLEDSLVHEVSLPIEFTAEPEPQPNILVLETNMLGISDLEVQTLSEYIRSEIITAGAATTVSLTEIKTTFEKMGLAEKGCSTDSCIQAVSGELHATHAIIWSLEKVEDRYNMDFKYLDVTDVLSTKKKLIRKYRGHPDGLITVIQQSIWDLLEVQPPEGRFPKEVTGIAAISQRITENRYLFGGAALVLVGAGIAIAVSSTESPYEGIELPPAWPQK